MWRIARMTGGWVCLGFGVIGLFLPFLQGILLIALGLTLLAPELPWARRLLDRVRLRRAAEPDEERKDGGA